MWILIGNREGGAVPKEGLHMDAWEQVKANLSARLTVEAFESWFARTGYVGHVGDCLQVAVPSEEAKHWIENEFSDAVRSAMHDLGLPYRVVLYQVEAVAVNGSNGTSGTNGDLGFGNASAHLNRRYTFDSFVVGACNQFAHAAATAVVERPGMAYNPLFIYGGPGMGKTHLIHAVAHEIARRMPSLRIAYTTGEKFLNQVVQSIRTDRMPLFHQYYRSADVLLVDDVHTVAGKERTEEEFFHTFNELYDHQKQIVLTSDCLPKNMPHLVERLRSRFEWGLLVDVQAPDLETKLAILDKKASAEGIQLPDEVRNFLAKNVKSSVRELEGALVKIIAFASVTRAPITVHMAQQSLRHLAVGGDRKISIDSIQRAVAERFQLQPSQIKQKSNQHQIAYPRQIAMYLAKELTTASLPELGRAFGGKHHTTVLHSIQKIERLRQDDAELNRLIHSLIDSFN
ncbi:MAG: chromosomal replication initiator protein DnaA [Bryobacteraceae bacterium]